MKTLSIKKTRETRSGPRSNVTTGTLPELVESYAYTLEVGKSYESEKGNKKINTNPKSIKTLVSMLNKAVQNSAANGYSTTYYEEVAA